LEAIFKKEILEYLLSNNLISSKQHGFLSRRSTLTNLIKTLNDWNLARRDKKNIHAVYTDFSKAFDTVSHQKLIYKLRSYGFEGEVLRWLQGFLSDRSQFVSIQNGSSRTCSVTSGVPQGTVLGPLLFLLFINDVPEVLKHSKITLYADDAKLFRAEDLKTVSSNLLQEDLHSFHRWSNEWQLTLAVQKCSVFIFGSPVDAPDYRLGETVLEVMKDINDLGVVLSQNQKSSVHCSKIARKCNIRAANIFRSFKCRKRRFLVDMFSKFVRPSLEYASQVWSPYLLKDIDCIESVQRRFTKRVPGLRHMSYPDRLRELSMESLESRRLKADLLLTFKIIHQKIDLNFDDYFSFSPQTGTRGHRLKLTILRANSDTVKNSFAFRVPKIWNFLPSEIIESQSIRIFKARLENIDFSSFLRGRGVS
jgi:hypothetical protein